MADGGTDQQQAGGTIQRASTVRRPYRCPVSPRPGGRARRNHCSSSASRSWKSRRSSWLIGLPERDSASSAGSRQVLRWTPGRDEQLDDPGLGRLHDRHPADGAPKGVRALVVVGADAHGHIGGRQLDVAAIRAAGSNGCHPADSSVWVEQPIGLPRRRLRVRSGEPGHHGASCQDRTVSTRLPSLRRPPIGFAHRGARAHAPENTLEAFQLALRLGRDGSRERRLAHPGRRRGARPRRRGRRVLRRRDRHLRPGRPARAHPDARRAVRGRAAPASSSRST